jgi:N-methylhydantoinase A
MLSDRVPVRGKPSRCVKTRRDARVGVDAGGTFTDVVVLDGGTAQALKVPTDVGLGEGLTRARELLTGRPTVVAGTTWVTNAVLERNLARTALVTTAGFADVLEIGRQARDDLYDLSRAARVAPPVPRELCFEVAERVGADGTPLRPLAEEETQRVAAAVRAAGVEAVAICLLHSYAHPQHEQQLAAALGALPALSVSHRVSRERREFERASTTALNAAVMPAIARYLSAQEEAVTAAFPGAPAFVVHSAGGMMTGERARVLPLATVMSGPAAGVAATARLARRFGLADVASLDMGGTSTDVCLLRGGIPATARDRRLGGHVVRLPAVAVESVGAGGGSVVWVDDVGALRVGPRSAGAVPGPAAYGRGGGEATVTDADVVLGLAGGLGGGLDLDGGLAREACARVGARLGLSAEEAAQATSQVTHAELERALRLVTVRRGYDLRGCTLVAFGGAGPMHAGAVALSAGIERVLVPAASSTFSALGCCLSELAFDDVRTCLAPLRETELPRVVRELERLVEDAAATVDDGHGVVRVLRALELRYHGQNDSLEVGFDGASSARKVRAGFDERHRSEFGYSTNEPVEVTAVRVRVWVDEGSEWASAPPTTAAGETEVGETAFGPVVRRGSVEQIAGPAVLVDQLSTVVVWPGQSARTDDEGNVWLERA